MVGDLNFVTNWAWDAYKRGGGKANTNEISSIQKLNHKIQKTTRREVQTTYQMEWHQQKEHNACRQQRNVSLGL